MNELIELAERCEKATGPDRRLDARIQIALNPDEQTIVGFEPGRFPQKAIHGPYSDFLEWLEDADKFDVESIAFAVQAPLFTSSLDAAKTLYLKVPERIPADPRKAAAEGLRQRAAALRSRAQTTEKNDG